MRRHFPRSRTGNAGNRHVRCQASGGARARKGRCGDAAIAKSPLGSSTIWLTAAASGTDGDAVTGYASCIAEQMMQRSSARPAGLWLPGTAGASGKAGGGSAAHRNTSGPHDRGSPPPRWTWPKDSASWIANANSAAQEPSRICERNQRITRSPSSHALRAPLSRAERLVPFQPPILDPAPR